MTTIQIVVVAVRDGIAETSGRGASLVVLSEFMGWKSALFLAKRPAPPAAARQRRQARWRDGQKYEGRKEGKSRGKRLAV